MSKERNGNVTGTLQDVHETIRIFFCQSQKVANGNATVGQNDLMRMHHRNMDTAPQNLYIKIRPFSRHGKCQQETMMSGGSDSATQRQLPSPPSLLYLWSHDGDGAMTSLFLKANVVFTVNTTTF